MKVILAHYNNADIIIPRITLWSLRVEVQLPQNNDFY